MKYFHVDRNSLQITPIIPIISPPFISPNSTHSLEKTKNNLQVLLNAAGSAVCSLHPSQDAPLVTM